MVLTFLPAPARRVARWALAPASFAMLAAVGCTVPPAAPPAPPTNAPRGSFDSATGSLSPQTGVQVSGWVDDADAPGPATVRITVDGVVAAETPANTDRADVAAGVAGAKLRSGFSFFVPTSTGPHTVCAWAVNAGPAAPDAALGCRSLGIGYTLIVPPVNGHPVRWSGAAAVPYKTRTDNAYPEALQDIQDALASITTETGITFTYLGNDDSLVPSQEYGRNGEPLLIGWVSAAESDLFAGAPTGVVGVAGSWYNASGNFVSGRVALEKNRLAPYSRTGAYSKMTVILHELGHAVGLGHINDENQLMNPVMVARGTWGAGDQLGLHAVSPPPGAPAMRSVGPRQVGPLQAGPTVFD